MKAPLGRSGSYKKQYTFSEKLVTHTQWSWRERVVVLHAASVLPVLFAALLRSTTGRVVVGLAVVNAVVAVARGFWYMSQASCVARWYPRTHVTCRHCGMDFTPTAGDYRGVCDSCLYGDD